MGSWKGTCMLTNLPIKHDDKVKLILLKTNFGEGISSSSFCYSNGLMTPAFLSISGKYDEGGMINEIDKDWNYEFIESILKKRYSEIKSRDNLIKDFNLEQLLKVVERGDEYHPFMVKNTGEIYGDKKSEDFECGDICFVMIREDVWNGIVKNYKGSFWRRKDWGEKKIDGYYSALQELTEFDTSKGLDGDRMREYTKITCKLSDNNVFFTNQPWAELAIGKFGYNEMFMGGVTISLRYSFREKWLEHITICSFMEDIRKSWMIQSGAGSQDENWKHYLMLNNIVSDICHGELAEESE